MIETEAGAEFAAQEAADELKAAASDTAQQVRHAAEDRANQIRDMAESSWEDAKVRAQDLIRDGEEYVRDNPARSVVTALGVGFVLGLLFRR